MRWYEICTWYFYAIIFQRNYLRTKCFIHRMAVVTICGRLYLFNKCLLAQIIILCQPRAHGLMSALAPPPRPPPLAAETGTSWSRVTVTFLVQVLQIQHLISLSSIETKAYYKSKNLHWLHMSISIYSNRLCHSSLSIFRNAD